MYALIRALSLRDILLEQVPVLGVTVVIAELFYKFHSFTLECFAFLATWYVLDAFQRIIRGRIVSTKIN
jgi:hypothetical protein